jgi:hypothetical protein
MRKGERREAFGDVLSASLARTVDFLRFAETKNAALLTFASAWTFASINMLTGERGPEGILGRAFWVALILFSTAAVVAVLSFLPKLNLHALHRDPTQPKNLLYFGHVAEFDTAVFRTRVQERYLAEGDQSITDAYLDDLTIQISANSKIAHRKFLMFNVGAGLVLIALLALALAAASAAINRATAGALLWA